MTSQAACLAGSIPGKHRYLQSVISELEERLVARHPLGDLALIVFLSMKVRLDTYQGKK